jgi:hypothetical protein
MEQSPFMQAKSFCAIQELLRKLWNRQIHFRIQKSPPPVFILSQMNPFRTLNPIS